jgi:hypothetical protein
MRKHGFLAISDLKSFCYLYFTDKKPYFKGKAALLVHLTLIRPHFLWVCKESVAYI